MLLIYSDSRGLVDWLKDQPSALILPKHVVFFVVCRLRKINDFFAAVLFIALFKIERVGELKRSNVTHKENIMVFNVVVGGCQWYPTDLINLLLPDVDADDFATLREQADDFGWVD